MRLTGVNIRTASSVLALVEPQKYCVIDFRGWRALSNLMGEYPTKESFTKTDYWVYLENVHQIAEELDWPVQEVDLAIWHWDKKINS